MNTFTTTIILFSAHAEVFPTAMFPKCIPHTLLRARGGISPAEIVVRTVPRSSPRTRRYFHVAHVRESSAPLFSAHAEVFPGHAGRSA